MGEVGGRARDGTPLVMTELGATRRAPTDLSPMSTRTVRASTDEEEGKEREVDGTERRGQGGESTEGTGLCHAAGHPRVARARARAVAVAAVRRPRAAAAIQVHRATGGGGEASTSIRVRRRRAARRTKSQRRAKAGTGAAHEETGTIKTRRKGARQHGRRQNASSTSGASIWSLRLPPHASSAWSGATLCDVGARRHCGVCARSKELSWQMSAKW
jgi:hypothetical protein